MTSIPKKPFTAVSLSITLFFFSARFPPTKRDTAGIITSISVPVVFNTPSRNELSINLRVSSVFRFSSSIITARSFSLCSSTNFFQSSSTSVRAFILVRKFLINSILLRRFILKLTAFSIVTTISLFRLPSCWYFFTSIRI